MSKVFIDSNILLYTADQHDPKKSDYAKQSLRKLHDSSLGVISTQVQQELYVVMTRKFNVEPLFVKKLLILLEKYEIVTVDNSLIHQAIDCSILHQISFWDALIVMSARHAKCDELWTEDLNHGQLINGVKIVNIFKNE